MEIDLTTPALLFSAISLIMLAYTNRFLSYAGLVRALKEQHQKSHSSVTAAQIANLRQRLYLTRAMQVTGIASLLLCVVSMFFIYIRLHLEPDIKVANSPETIVKGEDTQLKVAVEELLKELDKEATGL